MKKIKIPKKTSRGELMRAVLQHFAEGGQMMIDAFFPRWNPGSTPIRILFGLDKPHANRKVAKQRLSALLWRLKQQGLVARRGQRGEVVWRITAKGRNFLNKQAPPLKQIETIPEEDGVARIVTFDIPEEYRRERQWFRGELLACGFRALQKSVYIAKRPLPEELIHEIDTLKLGNYIHILSIDQFGTVRRK